MNDRDSDQEVAVTTDKVTAVAVPEKKESKVGQKMIDHDGIKFDLSQC